MTEQDQALAVYGSIAELSGAMVGAAQRGDWDRLVELEQDCHRLIEKLKGPEPALLADPQFRQRKAGILRKVLADDAEVRRFTEPWMTRLEIYLGSSHQAKRLHSAYQNGPQ